MLVECKCGCGKCFEDVSNYGRKREYINGHNKSRYEHGGTDTKLHNIWITMRQRCHNKRYGRGISVCSKWKYDFVMFRKWAMIHGYKEGLTIDRINNDGNYEPSNCQWITQAKNSSKDNYKKKAKSEKLASTLFGNLENKVTK